MDEERLAGFAVRIEAGLAEAFPDLHCAVRSHVDTGGDEPMGVLILNVRTAEGESRLQAARTLLPDDLDAADVSGLVQIIGESLERLTGGARHGRSSMSTRTA